MVLSDTQECKSIFVFTDLLFRIKQKMLNESSARHGDKSFLGYSDWFKGIASIQATTAVM